MDSPERGALMLVRIVAAAFIGWAVVDGGLYFAVKHHKNLPVQFLPLLVKALPLIIGVVILIKAKALAQWLSDKLDL
jgi:hypothetical protein